MSEEIPDLPEWARFIVQYKNGRILAYSECPTMISKSYFVANSENCKSQEIKTDKRNIIVDDWKNSLINLETHDYKIIDGILVKVDKQENEQKHAHYKKYVKHLDYIDAYRIIDLYELNDPCFQHALKKILVPGQRGHKDLTKDINDIVDTMQRKLEMLAEDDKLC